MPAWSYSSIKTFDQCPKKYFHLKVIKDVKDTMGPEAIYGTKAHTAAEDYIKHGTPIPERFAIMRPVVETLAKFPGEKHAELRLGVRKTGTGYEPTTFFAKDVWWRGIVDLLIVNDSTAHMVDYKTGKSSQYADTKQLELLSLLVFKHFPQVKTIKCGLMFLVAKDLVRAEFATEQQPEAWQKWLPEIERLEKSYESDMWNPKPNFTCRKFCAVEDCEHNGRK